jgi:hypothetical protein
MVKIVILICVMLGPAAALAIAFTLLAIALDKIRV